MDDFLEDDGPYIPVPEHTRKHKSLFGIEPYIIGVYWNNPDKIVSEVYKSIADNRPYDERELLSKEELALYNKGELKF